MLHCDTSGSRKACLTCCESPADIQCRNTQENKPVTSSRDTQEVPYEAGLEMLRIITSYQSKTCRSNVLPSASRLNIRSSSAARLCALRSVSPDTMYALLTRYTEALEAQKKFLTSQIASASNATVSPSLTASAPSSAYSQWTQPIPYPHHFGNAPPAQIRT